MDELKPCPFCGGKATMCRGLLDGKEMPYVECFECAAGSDLYPTVKEAKAAWNRRVTDGTAK